MNAGQIEKFAKRVPNFGGIYRLGQLNRVKILGFPVSIIVLVYGHWIAIYMDYKNVEIMDSSGYFGTKGLDVTLCRFLSHHINNKNFKLTPKLQSENSADCGLYSLSFLYFRGITGRTLCEFCKLFSSDFKTNSETIKNIFRFVKKLESYEKGL